jgi:hypothetical protein
MNVQQILDRVALLIDHDISVQQQVTTLNEISRQLFRKFPVPDKFVKFTTTNIPFYDLSSLADDIAEDRIQYIVIDGKRFPFVDPNDPTPPSRFCMVVTEGLFIHPNEPDKTAILYYKPRHVTLSASNLSAVPTFPEDYHEILVYGLAKWIAGIQRDVDMVNNFQREYDVILNDAQTGLDKKGQDVVRMIW